MIKASEMEWIRTKLADTASEIFRALVARDIPPVDIADAVAVGMCRAMFEATLMRGKICGKIRSTMTARDAIMDLKTHEVISESILAGEIGSLQAAHSKYVWTGWISKRIKPL